jgi:mono/diheme cytochrome c family protein
LVTAASTVAEAGNALQLPGRARAPEADWNRMAQDMTARALEARTAADARDKQAVFDTGGRLYETCIACHAKFVIEPPMTPKPLPDFPADVPAPR